MQRRGGTIAGALLATWLATPSAAASEPATLPPSIEVRWSGAPGCPDQATVEQWIADRLARREGAIQAVVTIAFVSLSDGRYVLDLTVTTETAQAKKRLKSDNCEILARATSVVVGVAVDPSAGNTEVAAAMTTAEPASDASEVASTVVPEPPAGPEPRESAASGVPPAGALHEPTGAIAPSPAEELPPPAESQAQSRDLKVGVRALGGGSAGVIPGFGPGVGLAVGLLGRRWRVEGQFSHWFAQDATYDDPPGLGAHFSLWSGGLRGCGVPAGGPVEFPLCLGVEVGQVLADGFGTPSAVEIRSLWAAAVLAASVAWAPRPWIALWVGPDGMINLVRPGATRTGGPELFRTDPVGVRVLAGLEFRLGPAIFEPR